MKEHSLFRACAKVDLGIIRENIKNINATLPPDTKTVGVIKADAYGHGALHVALAINDLVGGFALATPDEALEIRSAIKDVPVMLLGYAHPDAYEDLILADIQPAIFRYSDAEAIAACAQRLGRRVKVNIKLDTGMGRIGLPCTEETVDALERISRLCGICLSGIFTHFSSADGAEDADREFTEAQNSRLCTFVEHCRSRGVEFDFISASNSAALIKLPKARYDLVRAGILTYGYYPSESVERSVKVTPALSLHSHIIQIKEVGSNFPVGYGRTFVSSAPMRIATVPVGYGDGYPRLLSNKGRVLIHGKYAPILGRICMDMFMVDVTDIPEARELDEVVLLGRQGEHFIDADEIATLSDTISYEIICNIGKRVPRIYVN